MRKQLDNDYGIEKLVFKVFMKHVKANKLYIAFRWSVNQDRANRDLIHVISSLMCDRYHQSKDMMHRIGCSFMSAHSVEDILAVMRCERGKFKQENNAQFQISLMNMVNMLLHNCIEHGINHGNMHILEKLGSDIFNEVGKTLFGDDFKDMTEEGIDPRQRELMEKMQVMNGMHGMRDLPPNASENFFKIMHDVMRKRREERRTEPTHQWNVNPWHNDLDYLDEDDLYDII